MFYHLTVLGFCRNSRVLNCRFYCIIPSKKTMHLHLSRAHGHCWSATDLASLFLHLILLSASLRASQTSALSAQRCYSPNASFVSPSFSLLALFLVKLALLILIHAQTTLTCQGPMAFLILPLDLTTLLVTL